MKLDEFFPFVLPEVLGCPDPTARSAIVMTALDFCTSTLSWTEIQEPMQLTDGVSDYELEAPSQAYVLTVRDVWVGSRRLQPMTLNALQDVMPDWMTSQSSEPVYYNSAVAPGSIRVFPTPMNVTGSLVIRAAFGPKPNATTLPDVLWQGNLDVIASGAKARLMLIPGQTWSNPQLGAYYQTKYSDGVLQARIEEAHDRVPGTITVRPRAFGF